MLPRMFPEIALLGDVDQELLDERLGMRSSEDARPEQRLRSNADRLAASD